ncbi:hypothetical protein CU098_013025 [Rhizopus stolonifer]|uniref:Uncharacterized protein n=1 Tax=Rhizopus stolonifer TaxID=4846 RepID=A0A367KVL4_RHIST|nr:hypothetical protein CU098_013025 [Rhizopus stolonifer]
MNMCAVSEVLPCTFFIAVNYKIHIYILDSINSSFKSPVKSLASSRAVNTGGGAESPHVINAIKVCRILEKEVLVSVSEWGEICIWETENLDKPPLVLRSDQKTWGITIHEEQGLLAVSSNNWKIKVFNILELTKDDPRFGKKKGPNILDETKEIEFEGHEHNIPFIDFNETGQYIASASIDGTTRVWDLCSGQMVTHHKIPFIRNREMDSWCWSVKFIKPGNFKYVVCTDPRINRRFMQRLDQGRSTSMVNVGLCNSANAPIFPAMNIGRALDLNAQEIEDEIYEEEINEDLWDNSLIRQDESVVVDYILQQRQRESNNSSSDNNTMNDDEEHDGWNEPIQGVEELFPGPMPGFFEGQMFQDINSRSVISPAPIDPIEGGWEGNADENMIGGEPTEMWGEEDLEMDIFEKSSPKSYHTLPMKDKSCQKDIGEYLMLSTAKDLFLLSTTSPKMTKIRHESDIISKVDVRSDRLLSMLDRITMVEWIPELELYIAASQKGTVALIRIIQLELEDGRQVSVFNNECYLPMDVLQSSPLYGMTVKKVLGERFSPITYQVFLFYYGGAVLGYNISRKDSCLTVDNFSYL